MSILRHHNDDLVELVNASKEIVDVLDTHFDPPAECMSTPELRQVEREARTFVLCCVRERLRLAIKYVEERDR